MISVNCRCGPNRHTFEGPNTIKGFCRWLYEDNQGNKKNPVIAIAHNSRGFDAQFILDYLAERGYMPKITPKGQEIMQLEVAMVKMKDSLNFLPMPLSALPKAFGFEADAKKGYFPHLFNKTENEDYVGPLPDPKDYLPDSMKDAAREKLLQWHSKLTKEGYVFNVSLLCYFFQS